MSNQIMIDEVLQAVHSAKAVEDGHTTIEELAESTEERDIQKKINELTNTIINALKQHENLEDPQIKEVLSDVENIKQLELPIDRKKDLYTSTLLLFKCQQTTLDPDQEKSHYAATFPGAIAENVESVTKEKVEVNFDFADLSYLRMLVAPGNWQSTGLYAPAGKTITITVPENTENLDVQIGSHTDGLGHLIKWDRAPIIAFKQTLQPGTNQISSPFGGLLYFIPTKSEKNKTATITVSGAVRAPYFILGETDVDEWNETIKKYPAPWAELQGDRVIHTIPSSLLQDIDAPDELMRNWDDFVEQYNDLVGITDDGEIPHRSPDRQHRYVSDIQISAGFMHAGYPMMLLNEPSAPHIVDFNYIKDLHDGWGFWHEMGHEYQQVAWFWNDIVEVSVNIYSLYIQDYYQNPSRLLTKDKDGQTYYDIAFEFLNNNDPDKNFNQIGLFERLVMIRQLQMAYGWEFFTNLHIAYRELPEEELPEQDNEQQKIDLFVMMASKVCGENLLEFFHLWGMPYTDEARKLVTALNLPDPDKEIWILIENGEGPN